MTEVLPLNTTPLPVKLRIEDYLLLDRSGAFDAYAKTELIDGEVFYVNAQHRPHARIKSQLFLAISEALSAPQPHSKRLSKRALPFPIAASPNPTSS
ncbi:hypothetical protein [Sphingomonas sp.]|uniref:hypothetical protein n=1 Tax=Sphingomonas sp. TaxID=28214 RepID=UPI0035A877AB